MPPLLKKENFIQVLQLPDANSGYETQEVGLKYPNQLGIYDMSGNMSLISI